MRATLTGLALALLLLGCGQAEQAYAPAATEEYAASNGVMASQRAAAPMTGYAEADAAADAPEPAPAPAEGGAGLPPSTPAGPAPVLYLAYAYQMSLELPAERFTEVLDGHVKACLDAGPRLCQLIGSSRTGDPDSYMSGAVNLRGEPNWLRGFMAGVERGAAEAGGRIKSQSTSTEDLTRAIVDTEANLKAKTTLRDRLQRLLASRPGKLSDLLEVERELARVNAEIDATQSNLAVMRTRVAMSELSLFYETSARPLRGDTFRPLGSALAGFLGVVVEGFANIVTVIAVLLPWALIVALLAWGVLALRKRSGPWLRRRPAPAPKPDPDDAAQGQI